MLFTPPQKPPERTGVGGGGWTGVGVALGGGQSDTYGERVGDGDGVDTAIAAAATASASPLPLAVAGAICAEARTDPDGSDQKKAATTKGTIAIAEKRADDIFCSASQRYLWIYCSRVPRRKR
jgi:hypothetical protein